LTAVAEGGLWVFETPLVPDLALHVVVDDDWTCSPPRLLALSAAELFLFERVSLILLAPVVTPLAPVKVQAALRTIIALVTQRAGPAANAQPLAVALRAMISPSLVSTLAALSSYLSSSSSILKSFVGHLGENSEQLPVR
jgi:hypothetical protein